MPDPIALGWQAWLTLGVIGAMLVMLVRDVARPDAIVVGCVAVLLAAGVVTPEDAFAGFSNSAVITVAALFVVAAGVQRTEALAFIDRLLFSPRARLGETLVRLMGATSVLSAFLNNTPLVAMFIPRVQRWAERHDVPASKLLIPLSHAAVLGGTVTLIGTSTNLVVSGLMEQSGLPPLGMFDLTPVGLAATAVGVVYFFTVGHRLLPGRAREARVFEDGLKDCTFELRVGAPSPMSGRTVEQAGLRALGDAYLSRIRRAGQFLSVTPDQTLQAGDELVFVGSAGAIDRLLAMDGLQRAGPVLAPEDADHTLPLYEAVVAPTSTLVGKTLREVRFREEYHGVVVAIQRREAQIPGALGRTPLQTGDLLLVEATNGFDRQWNARRDEFYLVAPRRPERARPLPKKAPLALVLLLGVVVLGGLEVVPIVTAAVAAAVLMLLFRCLSEREARQSVDLSVLLVIAASLGIGKAVETSGLAAAGAGFLVDVSAGMGPVAVLVLLYAATNLLTELITNNAAAALMLPVGLAAAAALGVEPGTFAVAVAVAASAGFMTPIGYQTNLMVMSAGGYRFTDFLRVGAPLNLLVMLVAVAVIYLLWM